MITTLNYRKVNNVSIFFDATEDFTNAFYVREKIANVTREVDPEVAVMYLEDTAEGYALNELGHVIDRAIDVFGINLYFEAGSTEWIGWEGMEGLDADDFSDDYEAIVAFCEENKCKEEAFMKMWPAEYAVRKAEHEARAELVQTLMALALKPGETLPIIPCHVPLKALLSKERSKNDDLSPQA